MAETASSVGTVAARILAAAGITEVFGVVGGKLAPFLRGVDDSPTLRWVGTRHEAAGAWMATAIAHRSGRLAACVAETGPGVHNLVGGLLTARNNSLPLIALTSANPTRVGRPGRGMFMAGNGLELLSHVSKWSARVDQPGAVVEVMHDAIRQALSGRPGPVHVEVPSDVLATETTFGTEQLDAPLSSYMAQSSPMGNAGAVNHAAALLARAERVLVIAGGGVTAAGAGTELRRLVAILGAAATSTQMGIGSISTADGSFIGHGGLMFGPAIARACREADVVLAVGCRFSSWMWDGVNPLVGASERQALIHVDIDPTVLGALTPITIGIVGDAKVVVGQLVAALEPLGEPGPQEPLALEPLAMEPLVLEPLVLESAVAISATPSWLTSLTDDYRGYRSQLEVLGADEAKPMHPAALASAIAGALPPDALVVYDGGHTTFWSNDLTPALEPRTRFHDPGAAHLGFGVPYAHALAIASPHCRVINITGDGAFGFSVQELDTARRERLNVVHVIHNNASWGVIRRGQEAAGFEIGTGLDGTDYAAIANGFGCHGENVETLSEVGPALSRALASGLPAVVDVRVRFEPHPGMAVFGRTGRG